MPKEPHETDCIAIVNGQECAERHVPLKEMCKGCELYWTRAAALAGKTPAQWVNETVAEHETSSHKKAIVKFRLTSGQRCIEFVLSATGVDSAEAVCFEVR